MARGKTSADASELEKLEWPYDWPPPWRSDRLLGHETAEKTMLAAHQSGRLHHAWLLAGPRGIGKATLAWRFARFLLCGQQQGGLFGGEPDSLDVPADAPGRSLVDARSHPDLFHLRRTLNPDTGRMRAEIAVDDVRDLGALHAHDAGDGQMAGRHRRRGRRDEPQQRQRGAEDPRGAAAQCRAADRRRMRPAGCCRPSARAAARLALQPLADEIVMRLLGDYAPGREGRGEGRRWRGSPKAASAARSNSPAPAAWTSTARWSTCWRRCPSSTCARLHGFAERFARRGEEANAAWRSLNYLFDGWLKGLRATRRGWRRSCSHRAGRERGLQAQFAGGGQP